MKRWLTSSGFPVTVSLAILALVGVVASAYVTYRHVFQRLNEDLNRRVLLAASAAASAAEAVAVQSEGPLWTEDEGLLLHEKLAVIRKTSQLENLFIFDHDLRSLADARPMIARGKPYTLFSTSMDAVSQVLSGRLFIDDRFDVGELSFRNAAAPVVVDGEIIGGAYAQTDLDFEDPCMRLRRNVQLAGVLSLLLGGIFLASVVAAHRHRNRINKALNRQSRLSMISLLSAGISHDIKNPLGTIMASAELLDKHTGLDSDDAELVGFIREGAARILDITQTMLSGGDVSLRCVFDAHELVTRLVRQLKPVAMEKNVTLAAEVDEDTRVWGSPAALRMALANVLKNAMEAVSPDQGSIRVTCRRDAHRVGLAVSDNGPGIDRSMDRKIFDPMVTTKTGGSGLGLPVTRQLLEDMHGSLELETEPGIGSTFILWIPEAKDDQDSSG